MTAAANPSADGVLAARIGLWLGPLLLLACLLSNPPAGMSAPAWAAVGLVLLMACWWATEALPIPVTALLPLLLTPALGIGTLEQAAAPYANPTIFLFLGGFLIGLAMQRWNLHRRIALLTLLAMGSQPKRQIAGFMLATAFLSMWVSNTATSIMMLPIGLSVIGLLGADDNDRESQRFATALLLSIAYAASIGGIATLIGTPPNALLAAFLQQNYGIRIGFGQWMLIGVPVAVLMLAFTWWWLTRHGFELRNQGTETLIRNEVAALGLLSPGEKRVGAVFIATAMAWIFQPLLSVYVAGINDTSIALAAGVALFIVPAGAGHRVFLMDWASAVRLPWGVLLLFGGGLSLASAIRVTGLAEWIAQGLGAIGTLPVLLTMALVVIVIIFLTEVTSNTATAAVFLPMLGAIAVAQGIAPELLAIPAAIAASCAFMMPVATPPNAIVFGSGHLRIQSMIRAGLMLNIAGILVVTLLSYWLVRWIW